MTATAAHTALHPTWRTFVLASRPRRRIGRPRPQRPGPRYPHRPARLTGPWKTR